MLSFASWVIILLYSVLLCHCYDCHYLVGHFVECEDVYLRAWGKEKIDSMTLSLMTLCITKLNVYALLLFWESSMLSVAIETVMLGVFILSVAFLLLFRVSLCHWVSLSCMSLCCDQICRMSRCFFRDLNLKDMKHVLFCPGSTVVEHSTLNPKIEGSNPTTWQEKMCSESQRHETWFKHVSCLLVKDRGTRKLTGDNLNVVWPTFSAQR